MSTTTATAAALYNVLPQNFPLPLPIINYILDETSSKLLSKLYKTCKYFYSKKRLIIAENFNICNTIINLIINYKSNQGCPQKLFFPDRNIKLWVTLQIYCCFDEPSFLAKMFKIISKCDIISFHSRLLPPITWKEFRFLVKNVVCLDIKNLEIVEYGYQTPSLEEIISCVPKVHRLSISPCNITSKTFETLLKIERNQKYSYIDFDEINGPLDVKKLNHFYRKNVAPASYINITGLTAEERYELYKEFLLWKPDYKKPTLSFF